MPRDLSANIPQALAEIQGILGDRLSRSKSDLAQHAQSESYFPTMLPDAVAFPETTAEVSALMEICSRHRCPVTGWGAGTSLEGHALAAHGGLIVDFGRMTRICRIDAENMCVTVEPGLTRNALNESLRDTGLFFSVDPGANASLGGMAMTRASGTTAVRYGTMRDNVMGCEVVLADGRVISTGGRVAKTSAGYDLTALMVGSEGTLGLVTGLTLKLHPQPEAVAAATCAFPDIDSAVHAVQEVIQLGVSPARIEFLDTATVAAVAEYAGASFPNQPHLFVEFHGSEDAVAEMIAHFGALIEAHGARGFEWSTHHEERAALWAMRHDAYHAIRAMRPGCRALVTDICVPISELARAVRETQADLAAARIPAPILGHVGDGNFHACLLIDPAQPAELEEAKRLSDAMVERALALGGTSTGEHGVGMGKIGFMRAEHGAAWDVMRLVKSALDPQGILNPGKIFP